MRKQALIQIGERIYERRKQLGFTQEALAEATNTTPQAISNYERGEREMKAGMIISVAAALRISTDLLLTGQEPPSALHPDAPKLNAQKAQLLHDIMEKCIQLATLEEKETAH